MQDVWDVLLGYWGLGGGNEISLFQWLVPWPTAVMRELLLELYEL